MAKKAAKKESVKESKAKEPAKKAAAPKTAPKKEAAPKAEKAEKAPKAEKAEKAEAAPKKTAKEKKAEAARAAAAAAADAHWLELKEKYGKEKAQKYSMTGQYQANQGIEHPKLGWGFILTNNNDRLEVVFQDGVKILISNYNPNQKI
jgi:hypothetical protein